MIAGSSGPIWIDLANSPHVLFFQPIIALLRDRGHEVVVTSRDFAQTVGLCELYGVTHTVVGEHGGATIAGKGGNLIGRVRELMRFVSPLRPSVAVSHNSYAQLVTARLLRVPSMTAMDYEHQPANHLAFRSASVVAVPQALPVAYVRRQGASVAKTWRYPGIKEDVTLAGFSPSPGYLQSVGLEPSRVTVVVRPPADMALYHRFENELFAGVLQRLSASDAQVVLLARTPQQVAALRDAGYSDMVRDTCAFDGRELVAAADLVISAGGSMNREAAVLGTPAFSVYAGKPGAVDAWLVETGRLVAVSSAEDVARIPLKRRDDVTVRSVSSETLIGFVRRIELLARGGDVGAVVGLESDMSARTKVVS